jgi:hypothetical protein
MLLEIINQRIKTYNDLTNKYENTELCSKELSSAINNTIIMIAILLVIYIILFILSVYYIFKCSIKRQWGIFYPIMLLLLSLTPYYGGIVTIGIIIYGMLNCGSVCDAPSEIFRNKY